MLFSSLPMYDLPELRPQWDRLWQAVRQELAAQGIAVEAGLVRDADYHQNWYKPGLLLGQTCGWPFVCGVRDHALPFVRFDFGVASTPGHYFSQIIASPSLADRIAEKGWRAAMDDPAIRFAVNSRDSQSGFRALGELADWPVELPTGRLVISGSHRNSIKAVAQGEAEISAIDAVSWQLLERFEPAAAGVRLAGHTSEVPGLPLIISKANALHLPVVRDALEKAVRNLSPADRTALLIVGLVEANAADYGVLEKPPFGNLRFA
ncbi:MAG: PhnD/SsuA/transferrin family substrate-binding protein [Rhizobiaceae bacterium]